MFISCLQEFSLNVLTFEDVRAAFRRMSQGVSLGLYEVTDIVAVLRSSWRGFTSEPKSCQSSERLSGLKAPDHEV